jgi:hypothetical protein
MNDPQHPYPTPSPAPQAAQQNPADLLAAVRAPASNHRQGRVARLEKEVRDRLNYMILDGKAYSEIIAALGEDGKSLNEDVLSRWRHGGGYQEWLDEQKDTEDMRLREEYAWEFVQKNPGTTLNQAAIKLATCQIRQALRAIGSTVLQTALEEKPENYVRLLNALSRLTNGAITCEHDRVRELERKANLEKSQQDPDSRSLSDKTIQRAEHALNLR